MTSQIHTGPVKNWKKDEHKHDEHEDIEKKVDIFEIHILNGILANKKNLISQKRFPGRIMIMIREQN